MQVKVPASFHGGVGLWDFGEWSSAESGKICISILFQSIYVPVYSKNNFSKFSKRREGGWMNGLIDMNRGINCLLEKLGVVETERLISAINKEKFDYTKWQ